jgi:hypothetical protein
MSTTEQQQIIIHGTSAEELMSVQRFIQREMIRFGEQNDEFKLLEVPPRLIWAEIKGIYLRDGQPWAYPFNRVVEKFPNIRVEVDYLVDTQIKKTFFGSTESQSEPDMLGSVKEEEKKENAYFSELQKGHVAGENSLEITDLADAGETLEAAPKPIRRESQTVESSNELRGVGVLTQPAPKVDAVENQVPIIQKQLVEAKEAATAAEILAKKSEDRVVAVEVQLEGERSKRKEVELELKQVRVELENIERLKREVEEQKGVAERKAKKAEINAVAAGESATKDSFMSSMLAIKAQMDEQSASSDIGTEGLLEEGVREQNLNSLSRIAHLIRQDKDADGMNAFHKAAKAGSFSEFSMDELNMHNLLLRDDEGNTALHWAAAKGILAEVPGHVLTPHNLLLRNSHRATCLHLAALGGCLGDLPADILTMDNVLDETDTGCTCLHLAAIDGHLVDIPVQFFSHEALNMKNRNGQTPIEVADAGGHGKKVPSDLRAVAVDPNASATDKLIKFKESMRAMRWQI